MQRGHKAAFEAKYVITLTRAERFGEELVDIDLRIILGCTSRFV